MLQWMGGSRRKVTTSRKSTQNRQKQYFEQRKRQRQTIGLENYTDGRNKHAHNYEEPHSLDVLSLVNLTTVTQRCGSVGIGIARRCRSGCTMHARENPEADDPQVNCSALKCSPTQPTSKISPEDFIDLNESLNPDVLKRRVAASTHPENESSHKCIKGITLDERKKSSENEVSVLDFLEDDEFQACSERRSAHEAHVAFSVRGLGKVGMETPVHSPRESNSFYSPPKAARRLNSSRNLKYVDDDLEVELNRIMHDVVKPSESPFKLSPTTNHIGYSRSPEFNPSRHMPLHIKELRDDFIKEETFCSDIENYHARLSFLDDNLLDERKYAVAGKNQPFQMNCHFSNSLQAANCDIFDYRFEDPCIENQRAREKTWSKFVMPDSPEHFTPRKDYEFKALHEERSRGFRSAEQPSWPFLAAENGMDNMSLLSEESCSSSAVRGEHAKESRSSLRKLKIGTKGHSSDLPRSLEKNVSNLYAKEILNANLEEVHWEKNLKGVRNYENMPNLSMSRTGHFFEFPATRRVSKPRHSFLFGEGFASFLKESDFCPLQKTPMEIETTSLNHEFRTKDGFLSPFSIPESYPNREASKRDKFNASVDYVPSSAYFSDKDVSQKPFSPVHLHDSHSLSSIKSGSMKLDTQLASRREGHPPYSYCMLDLQKDDEVPAVCRRYNDSESKDVLVSRPPDCKEALKELPKGVSITNSDLSSRNEKTVDVADFKDSCSECEEAHCENPEPIESSKRRNSPEHGEETPATTERPDKIKQCINAKKYHNDAAVVLLKGEDEEKETFAADRSTRRCERHCSSESSYQVMLESYVLQLLCVQKVLKEASCN